MMVITTQMSTFHIKPISSFFFIINSFHHEIMSPGTPLGALGMPGGAFLDFDENWGPRERGCMHIYSKICVFGTHPRIPRYPRYPLYPLK